MKFSFDAIFWERMNFITIDCSRYAERYLILHDVVICYVFNFRFQQFVSSCLFCKFFFFCDKESERILCQVIKISNIERHIKEIFQKLNVIFIIFQGNLNLLFWNTMMIE